MTRLLCAVALSTWAGLALGQSTLVPTCDGTNGPNCTDYFGAGNWANSPLPGGAIAGLQLVAGGYGYVNPVVVITDGAGKGSGATATATVIAGVVSGFTLPTDASGNPVQNGAGYVIPQVTIVDVGAGGVLGAPTCGGSGQPACGSGAMAIADLGPPFVGGMPKFQAADALPLPGGRLPLATPDRTTFPGSDYYEIALVQYQQSLHSSLLPTTLRGYVQLPTGTVGCPSPMPPASYLGPVIVATKNVPVRVKFTNCLPAGAAGGLFVPDDASYMGDNTGPDGVSTYTENRATLHLHGGATPWISDGTPHQWTVPVGETAPLQKGDSVQTVPDMWFDAAGKVVPQCTATVTTGCSPGALPTGATHDPGQGSLAFFWSNQQGGRLMFYHDHAYGITRLNVYAGEAAGYLLVDPVEEDALANGSAPGTLGATTAPDLAHLIPLVIQAKTFVPDAGQIGFQDPTWAASFGTTPGTANPGDLWFPHVYMPNQNPADPGGANAFGRWDYGPWFFPPQSTLTKGPGGAVTVACASSAFPGQILGPSPLCPDCGCPITPNPSGTPEGFMDTPVVNGVAYPVLHVAPEAYRFRILTAGNDRSLNLSWFVADPAAPTEVRMLPAAPPAAGAALPLCGAINPVAIPSLDMGLATALFDGNGNPLNGTGLPANCWPNYGRQAGIPAPQTMWAADGRAGGAPDPTLAGPPWIQIGTEGGLLPSPVVIPATPVNYEQNTRSVTVTNVAVHGLWLGPAERADVIVDFSQFAGRTLILYNDAPAPAPAFDSRNDYFTGDGDQSAIGGAPGTVAGYGPNTRTIMQVVVDGTPSGKPFSLSALRAAFQGTSPKTPGVFGATQPAPIVPEAVYGPAYGTSYPNAYASISANTLTFTPFDPTKPLSFDQPCNATPPLQCGVLDRKAIQELFTLDYGRMNATLGTELPFTNFLTQTTIPLGYVDPPTEIVRVGDSQLWKITHNGVDTHFIHFHLFNVQVVNRMGWDGTLRPPDPNEVGWKDTVRMNPLEDILVALQPIAPDLPFPLPNAIRNEDVTAPVGSSGQFTNVDPNNNPANVVNDKISFGWEYVWHCHILGHEENDMMRPIVFQVPPRAPDGVAAALDSTVFGQVDLSFVDESASETGFTIQRDVDPAFPNPTTVATLQPIGSLNAAGEGYTWGGTLSATDQPGVGTFYYRAQAVDDGFKAISAGGLSQPYNATPALRSAWSKWVAATYPAPAVSIAAPGTAVYGASFTVTAATNSGVMPTIAGTAGVCSVGAVSGTPTTATATVTMLSGTGTCTLTASWPATAAFAAGTATAQVIAQQAQPTVTFAGAPGSAPYNGSFVVTATTNAGVAPAITGTTNVCTVGGVTGTSPATATVTMTSGTGTCTVTASWPATANYLAATASQATTAAKVGSTTAITSATPNPAVAGQQVTVAVRVLSAVTLTGGAAGPTGTVTVTGGGQSCSASLSAGVGSCTLTWPAAGAQSVVATYGGDASFNPSASPATTVQVRDFTVTLSPSSVTSNGTQQAKYTITVTPQNGFTGRVALSCAGNWPSTWSCSVSTTSLNVPNASPQTATITVRPATGSPGTYTLTGTAVFGTGVPASGGLTHSATANVVTTR